MSVREHSLMVIEHATTRDLRRRIGLGLLLAALILCGVALALCNGPNGYHSGFHSVQSLTAAIPGLVWMTLSLIGDEKFLVTALAIACVRRPELISPSLIAAVAAVLVTHGMKLEIDALRPAATLDWNTFEALGPRLFLNSFPSGHTLAAFAAATMLFRCIPNLLLRATLMLVAFGVGLSRVAAGVHWPVDALVGASLGICIGAAAPTLAWRARLIARHSQRFFWSRVR